MEEPQPVSSTLETLEDKSPAESPVKELEEPLVATKAEEPTTEQLDQAPTQEEVPETETVTEEGETSPDKLIDGADVLDSVGNSDPGTPYSHDEAMGSTSASASEDEHPHSSKPKRNAVKLQGITPDGASMYSFTSTLPPFHSFYSPIPFPIPL